ncbi:MAG: dethiobiotin synthase [Pseudomonadota bacterium]
MTYFVTGTDTDVGKTIASAWLMLHMNANYWKPIQSGLEEKDIDAIKKYTALPDNFFFPSTYELTQPLSPHESAKRDNIEISLDDFSLPKSDKPLIVEGAGGLQVPINKEHFVSDLITHLALPVIVVCRSGLGTINHTLLTLEALRKRNTKIKGLIMSGEKSPHNREALEEYGQVPIIAEIDHLSDINPDTLLAIKPEITL